MRQLFDHILRVRVPSTLSERLKSTAEDLARTPSDVVREAVVVQLDRLARRKATIVNDDQPPEAA